MNFGMAIYIPTRGRNLFTCNRNFKEMEVEKIIGDN